MYYHHDRQTRARSLSDTSASAATATATASANTADGSATIVSDSLLSAHSSAVATHCRLNTLQKFLIVITYTNQIFSDNALGLKRAIERLQPAVANVVTIGDFNYYDLKLYLRQYLYCHQLKALQGTRQTQPSGVSGGAAESDTPLSYIDDVFENQYYKVIQIAIGAHEPALLLKHYIPFDVEQVWSLFMQFDTYELVLRSALAVFTMSKQHSEKLKSSIKGIDKSKIIYNEVTFNFIN